MNAHKAGNIQLECLFFRASADDKFVSVRTFQT